MDSRPDRAALIDVRIHAARYEAERVLSFELRRVDGEDLPSWTPGAHLNIHLPSGATRQYSLSSDNHDLSHYRIGVLKVVNGRGGSSELHQLRVGTVVQITAPVNTFPLDSDRGALLLAGGIGITPILAMARELSRRGNPSSIVYAGRALETMAFLEEVREVSTSAIIMAGNEHGRPDFDTLIDAHPGVPVYACGPTGMLDAVKAASERAGAELRIERFAPEVLAAQEVDEQSAPEFSVRLTRAGQFVGVRPGVSILEAVRDSGVSVDSSCEMGVCGTCETRVLKGRVDHRDMLLSPDERERGDTMMICVSRSKGGDLELDL
jgi:ferredoxin-NADP reductase